MSTFDNFPWTGAYVHYWLGWWICKILKHHHHHSVDTFLQCSLLLMDCFLFQRIVSMTRPTSLMSELLATTTTCWHTSASVPNSSGQKADDEVKKLFLAITRNAARSLAYSRNVTKTPFCTQCYSRDWRDMGLKASASTVESRYFCDNGETLWRCA